MVSASRGLGLVYLVVAGTSIPLVLDLVVLPAVDCMCTQFAAAVVVSPADHTCIRFEAGIVAVFAAVAAILRVAADTNIHFVVAVAVFLPVDRRNNLRAAVAAVASMVHIGIHFAGFYLDLRTDSQVAGTTMSATAVVLWVVVKMVLLDFHTHIHLVFVRQPVFVPMAFDHSSIDHR